MKNVKQWRCFIISLLLVSTAFTISCTRDEVTTTQPDATLQPQIADAQQWFEQQMYTNNYLLNENGMQLYTDWRLDWGKAAIHELSTGYTVEVPILFTNQSTLISSQLRAEYERTGNSKYLATKASLVIETNLTTGKKQDFIMVVSPSLKYVESNSKGQNSYLSMDNDFDGMVIYYTPSWDFANGWGFSDGKIDRQATNRESQTRSFWDCPHGHTIQFLTIETSTGEHIAMYTYHICIDYAPGTNPYDDGSSSGGTGSNGSTVTTDYPPDPSGSQTGSLIGPITPPKKPIYINPGSNEEDNPYDSACPDDV